MTAGIGGEKKIFSRNASEILTFILEAVEMALCHSVGRGVYAYITIRTNGCGGLEEAVKKLWFP